MVLFFQFRRKMMPKYALIVEQTYQFKETPIKTSITFECIYLHIYW